MKRSWMLVVGAVSLALALAGCGSKGAGGGEGQGQGTAAGTTNAQALYKSNCLACHGDQLQGGMGPKLQKVGAKLSAEQITAKVQNGGGGMPAYTSKLKPEEIQALAAWLAENK
ncbi:cytochrome c [Paenibacillus filicis]|uniref:Cytochrome c n=1 Tax=Paenibacillus filicis TaxID=669464 RepID=A0ABU9DTH7_9BACL